MFRRIALSLTASLLLLGAAPSPSPSSTPAHHPAITAFSGTGTMTAQVVFSGSPIGVEAHVAAWDRPGLVRLDLRKLVLSGQSSAPNPMLAQMLPTGGVSAVFNQAHQTLTVWSSQTHRYYQTKVTFSRAKPKPRKPAPKSKPTPKPKATPHKGISPLKEILKVAQRMTEYDVYSQTFELMGHKPVNGHMASVFDFASRTQRHGGKLETVDGELALADDLSGIPLHLAVDASGNMTGKLRMDLESISTATPAASLFAIPKGYKKVKSLLDVLHM